MTEVVAARPVATEGGEGPDAWSAAWGTVLVLAVAMSLADVFWVVSLREAVGAVERTSHPATHWARESAVLLPGYALAVLGARHLALPRVGHVPRRAAHVVVTAGLVALLGTLVGVLALAVSSAYDYRLEMALLARVRSHGTCIGDCLAAQRAATADQQLASVGYGTVLIGVTNLLLVAWLVALAGGRLRLGGDRHPTWIPSSSQLVAAGLVGASLIHLAVAPDHLREWPAAGLFFVVLAAAATATAAAVLRGSPSRIPPLAAVAVCAVPLTIWLCSRTVGLPAGPGAGEAEPIGLADSATAVLELGVLLLLVAVHRTRTTRRSGWRAEPTRDTTRMALVAVVAVTVWGLAGGGIGWLDVTVDSPGHAAQ